MARATRDDFKGRSRGGFAWERRGAVSNGNMPLLSLLGADGIFAAVREPAGIRAVPRARAPPLPALSSHSSWP